MSNKEMVRVRIGPSPTGDPHVGTAYISLFNFAFAKKNNGKFILRIEDTDRNRSRVDSEKQIIESLKWLGLSWDEGPDIGGQYGPYRQSERLSIYKKHAETLEKSGKAYKCICSAERLDSLRQKQMALKQPTRYDRKCRDEDPSIIAKAIEDGTPYVLRMKAPLSGDIVMDDMLRGKIVISSSELDDQVLMKSDGFPTYHLASVVDDHEMRISHVIRGEEWISSLPKHVILYDAFGFEKPKFCHLPLLRNADKSKVSKRKNPVSLNYFKQAGFLPEVMNNFLGLMAYSLPTGEEIFSLEEFIKNFDINRISLGGPVFDLNKLTWMNGKYLRESLSTEKLTEYVKERLFSHEYISKIVPLVQDRMDTSEDFIQHADFFFQGKVPLDDEKILIKNDAALTKECLWELVSGFDTIESTTPEAIGEFIKGLAKNRQLKPKEFFMPVRMIISGRMQSPPLFETMSVLGKEKCRFRLVEAIKRVNKILIERNNKEPS